MRFKRRGTRGFTLIEVMLVIAIMATLASLATPKFAIVLTKAHQAKSKGNLGNLRTAISLYASDNEGSWPMHGYPEGDDFYSSGISMSTVLVPKYIGVIPTPKMMDGTLTFNGLDLSYDQECENLMALSPPKDVFIVYGAPAYTPMLDSPYAYDSTTGQIYYPNGNYDSSGVNYFYNW